MDTVVQQSLTITFGTVAPILLVGGGAFAWLRSDIRRVEMKSEDAHKDIRDDIGDLKQSNAKMQAEIQCLNDKVDSIDRRLDNQ